MDDKLKKELNEKNSIILFVLVGIFICVTALVISWTNIKVPNSSNGLFQSPLSYIISQTDKFVPRPGSLITKALTAYEVSTTNGQPVRPSKTFKTTDKSIYLVVFLKDVKIRTKISYVRFINNKFLDQKSFFTYKNNSKILSFDWTLKNVSQRSKGTYEVKLYSNNIYETSIFYYVN